MEWNKLTDNEKVLSGTFSLKLKEPTPVQEAVYKKILEGKNLLVKAETGTGKTFAYLLPLFEKYKDISGENKILILVPTHELAMQVAKEARKVSTATGIPFKCATAVGNANINHQIEALKNKPEVIVGSAGRVLELIEKKKIAAHLIKTIVLDEGDRLFDKTCADGTHEVIKKAMRDVQLLLFSASSLKNTKENFEKWKSDCEEIDVTGKLSVPKNIHNWYVVVDERYKIENLRGIIKNIRTKKAMIFINNPAVIEAAYEKLSFHHYSVDYIHGDRKGEDRKKAIDGFNKGKIKYLLATDVAARGLHFDGVDTVFHVSLAEKPTDYLHRAGRTGRNGAYGRNIVICSKKELPLIKRYEKELNIVFEEKQYEYGKFGNKRP
ncbi:MAG: DEAD/DEAH box helicase [Lachnospiraceae bacterium]|nr:DEAD/DEAH box helicase [Lachnospiraceae bacterium]